MISRDRGAIPSEGYTTKEWRLAHHHERKKEAWKKEKKKTGGWHNNKDGNLG